MGVYLFGLYPLLFYSTLFYSISETNLKIRQAIPQTAQINSDKDIASFKAVINCEVPNNRLYAFDGTITFNGNTYPLDAKQVMIIRIHPSIHPSIHPFVMY